MYSVVARSLLAAESRQVVTNNPWEAVCGSGDDRLNEDKLTGQPFEIFRVSIFVILTLMQGAVIRTAVHHIRSPWLFLVRIRPGHDYLDP
jgi:hypothetical protein